MPTRSRLAAALGATAVAAVPSTVVASSYVVHPGDTLGDIAIRPGRLARMNALLTYVAGDIAVDARLMRAVAWAESTWRQEVVSSTGAVGVMQLEPYTGDWVSRHVAGRRLDIWVAQDNVLAGGLLLKHIGGLHDGDVGATLAAYYQGAESVGGNGLFDDTCRYLSRV